MAPGAAEAGTVMCLSTLATTRPAEVAAAAPGGRRWFQLYSFKDAGVTRALMDEAVDAGFEAIVVTVDAPPGGNRERDRRNGFTLPEELGTPSLDAAAGGDRRADDRGDLRPDEPAARLGRSLADLASECEPPGPRQGPAHRRGRRAGGRPWRRRGRRLQPRRPPARPRPGHRRRARRRSSRRSPAAAPVLVDGGIRRGIDVAIALALGADAVLVGRPALWGLAAAGARRAPASSGCCATSSSWPWRSAAAPLPAELTRAHVWRAPATSVYSV